MSADPTCPACSSKNTYFDGNLWVCPECSHEWSLDDNDTVSNSPSTDHSESIIKDAHGNALKDGDSVTVIKDLKIKGASGVVKSGTKVKNIRLVDAGDGHDISCKIDGLGSINLKSEFVKKI
jgi:protein PhnA